MAEKDVLSQEEIDALLESVDDSEEEESTDVKAENGGKKTSKKKAKGASEQKVEEEQVNDSGAEVIKAINFVGQERIVKGHLPVLDKIYDRAIRLFTSDIYHLTTKEFEIKQEPLVVVKNRDFMSGLPNPSYMGIYKFKPLRGKGVIIFDSTFVYDLVDYYFGGSTQFFAQKDKTDFTATELKVMDVISKKLIADLILAWEPILHVEINKVSDETNPQMVNITEPNGMLLVARFTLDFGKETGAFHLVFPYSMMEPIKQQLELGASRPDDEIDPNWIKSLKEELMDVELTVTASMSETTSSLGKVTGWKTGDFVPLEMSDAVVLDVEGTPNFTGTLGTANEKRAIKIINKIRY